jgi:hypothetical protein
MSRPQAKNSSMRYYVFVTKRWFSRKLPKRSWWKNQKIGDAELLALHVARMHFRHPYASVWWKLMQDFYPHLPSYTQAYTRLFKLLPLLELLLQPKARSRRFVVVDSQPIPACKWQRRNRCMVVAAWEGYGKHGPIYGFRLHAWASPKGEILLYSIRSADQHDYTVAKSMLQKGKTLGNPIKIADKAYVSAEFVTPPKKNSTSPSRWKAHYSKMRKRIETVFSQLVNMHIRTSQFQTLKALQVRVALAVLAHNFKVWGLIS